MALYSKRQFADLCKVPTNNLSNYIKRGHVVLKGGKPCKCVKNKCTCLIDSDDQRNELFLQKQGIAEDTPPPPVKGVNRASDSLDKTTPAGNQHKSRLATLAVEKFEKQNRLLDAQISKAYEEILPREHAIHLLVAQAEASKGAWMRASETLLTQVFAAFQVPREEQVYWRKHLTDVVNDSVKDAHAHAKKNLRRLAAEYAGKKGKGVHNDL